MSEDEISVIVIQLDQLMGELRANVDALQEILTQPEVPGDQPESA